jgi:hypothetical protein
MLAVFTEFERLTKRPLEEQGCQADNRECDTGGDGYPQELVPTNLHLENQNSNVARRGPRGAAQST